MFIEFLDLLHLIYLQVCISKNTICRDIDLQSYMFALPALEKDRRVVSDTPFGSAVNCLKIKIMLCDRWVIYTLLLLG